MWFNSIARARGGSSVDSGDAGDHVLNPLLLEMNGVDEKNLLMPDQVDPNGVLINISSLHSRAESLVHAGTPGDRDI